MSVQLQRPEAALALRILAVAPYGQRLRVGRLVPPLGLTSSHVRSLRELHRHLEPDPRSLPGVDIAAVADWIEDALGDCELAGHVRTLNAGPETYVDKCKTLHELVSARLAQALEAVGEELEL